MPYYNSDYQAYAMLKGRPDTRFPLFKIVRTEPYIVPKKSLTGNSDEKVDTRVFQVIYALPEDRPYRVYVGQQMDVFFELPRAGKEEKPRESDTRRSYELPGKAEADSRGA